MLRRAVDDLRPSRTASLDAQLILAHVLSRDRAWVLAHHDGAVHEGDCERFLQLLQRRASGEPVAYLLGRVEWYNLTLEVTPAVLIPRPETEHLLERACEIASRRDARLVADIGTGCGALAVGIARGLFDASVVAVDSSSGALEVARCNVERYGLTSRVRLVHGDLIEPLESRPDLIVANLPYLSDAMMEELDRDVRHEPRGALYGGPTGLEPYEKLVRQLCARDWRIPVIAEIDPRQADAIRSVLQGWRVEVEKDYAGWPRIAIALPGVGQ